MAAARKFSDLASEIRKNVLAGRYGTEGGLPEIREIALRYGVAKNTVIAALSNLEGQGLIEKRGHSYYVNQLSVAMTEYVPSLSVRLPNSEGYYKNIGSVEKVPIPEHLISKFKVPPDAMAVFRVQVSGELMEGKREKPLQISYRYHFIKLSDEDVQHMRDFPDYDPLWDKEEYAIRLFSVDEVIPRLATEEERDILQLPEGTPITYLFETISRDNEILMAQEIILSPRETLIFAFPFENRPKS